MPWLTTYDSTNKVVDEERDDIEDYTYHSASTTYILHRSVTVSQYRYVGMTLSAAQACKTAINDPPTLIAVVRRESAGGSYCVQVTVVTKGTWAL